MKRLWISATGGIVIGIIISLYIFRDKHWIVSYQKKYPEDTYTVSGLNFELIADSSRIIIISIVIIFVGWILTDKLRNRD